ncbi:SpoIIE family protein phosphatase [Mycolicibacter senuensis]|uniref:SpoIIE family protein phosphatase n=1 Tax=Mycolicibacter senuensis TaxID=386913 RepID=UPI001F28AD0A|nr:SpoIIE family protein phosphatase [Mycolicibacter senuensis]
MAWPAELRGAVSVALTSRFPIVLWLGSDDLFLVYNDAYLQILGDKHPDALGRRGREVWWDIWDPISPMLNRVLTTGLATWADDLMLPVSTAGQAQERYFTFTYSPLIGGGGAVNGIFCAVAETTQRVLSDRRLHLLNAVSSAVMQSRTVGDAVNAAIAVCDGQPADLPFVAVYAEDADDGHLRLRGATPAVSPVLPPVWTEPVPGISDSLPVDAVEQALVLRLGYGAAAGALVIGLSPRRPLDVQYRAFCQLLADQLSSALSSATSYAQQRQRADALAAIDRSKTAFLTNVSHEFRTPLTLLQGPLDEALAEVSPGSPLADRLTTARRNAGRLLRLVDSLLDFARVEAGRVDPALVCTDVGALTAHIASSFSELCRRAGLELVLECRPSLADIDATMWETIVLNLVSNAVKYTLDGAITVTVEDDEAGCRIAVRDTGVGIAQDDLERLGERFFRADDARGRSVEGTGIGLSLVRGLVELQGGTIAFDSVVDRGTVVTITLPGSSATTPVEHQPTVLAENPYVVEAGQWVDRAAAPAPVPADRRSLVLIVDDNADMREHLDRLLSTRWRTARAADGEAALAATRELRPDAVVSDVVMPRMDGFDYVAAVRADPDVAATPILMLSARAGAAAASEGYAGGADDYLLKPFRSEDLIDRVAARMSAAARERDKRRSNDEQARRSLDVAHLDGALQSAESVDAVTKALKDFPLFDTDATVISLGLLDPDGRSVRFHFAGPLPPELRDRFHIAAMDTPLVPIDVIQSGSPMIVTDTADLGRRYEHVVQQSAGSVGACVTQPLRGPDGRVIGSLGLLFPEPRDFDPVELGMYASFAAMTQAALDRIQLADREHRIAVEFQEHLLDLDRGSTTAAVAAVYRAAGETMRVGGDWYLAVPLERAGRIAVSVGDVVGHGLSAATVMSRLRAAAAASALSDAEPTAVLDALDRYAGTVAGARCATVSYAVVDAAPADGAAHALVSYACAGHPYPLLITRDRPAVFLESGRRPPMAAGDDVPDGDAAAIAELPPGSLLLLYTDGLIERPGEAIDDGFDRLRRAAEVCADLPVDDVCTELLDRMRPAGGYVDDVVLLALRPSHGAAGSFTYLLPAELPELSAARHRLRRWLAGTAVDQQRQAEMVVAIDEAVTNAIEHGSRCDPCQTVAVEAFVRDGTVAVTVSDSGRWSGDSSASRRSDRRGRGLTLINGLADRVDTVRAATGTRVTLYFDDVVGS